VLLSYSGNAQSAQSKVKEKIQNPLQTLSQKELSLISDLGKKTEMLYNAMNDENFFG
jgi:hypothetical protein